ncbi:ORC1 [Candida oxycetoniae]|uniref:Origin recognition complex subunit 1 n=1 Tax=Candida oxycetoniae TaxID=497107 RepID=A0AAI9WXT6_9ASCO|nr:ORC1 [Candida oxycetoniae]KAI3404652.2 ORC1 [Candida oxycetoniae]
MSKKSNGWDYIFGSDLGQRQVNDNDNEEDEQQQQQQQRQRQREEEGEKQEKHQHRRSSRRKTDKSNQIILRRQSDQFEVKVSDTILVNYENETLSALVRDIRFGASEIPEVFVLWFSNKEEVEDTSSVEILENEIFLTPYLGEVKLNDIIADVKVLSEQEFKEIVIDESNSRKTFMCRRATNEKDKFSKIFDYNDIIKLLLSNPDRFVGLLKEMLLKRDNKENSCLAVKKKPSKLENKQNLDSSSDEEASVESDDGFLIDSDEEASVESDNGFLIESDKDSDIYKEKADKGKLLSTPNKRQASAKSPSSKKTIPQPKGTPKKSRVDSKIEEVYSILTPRKRMRVATGQTPLPLLTSPTKPKDQLHDPKSEAFTELRARLHTSQRLSSLPGREDEFMSIWANLESAINEGSGCCIYVSGVPGMGKTATIKEVIRQMSELADTDTGEIGKFDFLEINGLKLLSPTVAYCMLWEQITGGDRIVDANAVILLEEYFKKEDTSRRPLVVLMDELDQIAQGKSNVMYNFFNWPTYSTSKLIVIAVANTMDLPERMLSNKVSSRMGLRRIQFKGYTFAQLGEIIKRRLDDLTKNSKYKVIVGEDAIGFASRKVASVSGDARRVLTICRRAAEIAEKQYLEEQVGQQEENSDTYQVSISHISQAINESVNSPLAQYLTALPFASKLFLSAMLRRMRRSGLAENSIGDLAEEMKNAIAMSVTSNPFRTDTSMHDLLYTNKGGVGSQIKVNLRIHNFDYILNSLVEAGIVNQQNTLSERKRLVLLNVSEEELVSVMKRDQEVSQYL